jgi:hypothetical protein
MITNSQAQTVNVDFADLLGYFEESGSAGDSIGFQRR